MDGEREIERGGKGKGGGGGGERGREEGRGKGKREEREKGRGETADNYSKLAALEEMRCSDGHFSFLLSYPSIPGKRNIWRSEPASPVPHTACGLAAERNVR